MSTRRPFIRPFPFLVALFVVFTPLALAADARLIVDPAVYDVTASTAAPTTANVALAYNGTALEVHVVKSGGTLPAINLGFSGETPRINPRDQVDLAEAIRRSPRLQTVVGGVVIQHRKTTEAQVRNAYIAALGDLGFTLHGSSNPRTWLFTNGTSSVRVNVAPFGENVTAYVGR
jgi:hypothetical protein